MTELNERIRNIPIPNRMRSLPVSDRGFPIPKFVPYVNGEPEFRGMSGEHMIDCIKRKVCWLCAQPLGVHMTFVMGPMCAINVNNAEPPCHYSCAEYAAKACPFLAQPRARRNEKDTPWKPGEEQVAGIAIKRNPGVALLWTCKNYRLMKDGKGGILFTPGTPEHIEAYCEGRRATFEEVMQSVESGLPILMDMAKGESVEAETECRQQIEVGIKLLQGHLQ